jgi:glycosyltransferase involved in cell wall biosynthesis
VINNRKIIVVLPAFNAEKTLEKTYREIPFDIVDDVVLVDDQSKDKTYIKAKQLRINNIIIHDRNKGYGGNQKTCYNKALELGADIVIMLHPDYQYTPKLIHSMCFLLSNDLYDVVLGSRIIGNGALKGRMPIYKYIFNRLLTLIQNFLMEQKLSEYHTGYRAFSAKVLATIDYENNSDDFVFDNQILAQACFLNYRIGEISCPTKYDAESSSLNFGRSVTYGIGVLKTSILYFAVKTLGVKSKIFKLNGDK